MRAKAIQAIERKINGLSDTGRLFLKDHPYINNGPVVNWLLGLFKRKIKGHKEFLEFDLAIKNPVKILVSNGDHFYLKLFRRAKFINIKTKEKESSTPYTDAIQNLYNRLFLENQIHDEKLGIYSMLRNSIEKDLGNQLSNDGTLQTYEKWITIDSLLEVEHEIKAAWLDALSLDKIKSQQGKFLSSKKRVPLAEIAILEYSHRDRRRAALHYLNKLRKISKKNAFDFVDMAVKAELVDFTTQVSLQQILSKKLGINELLTFIDLLKYPVAQHHGFFIINEMDDFVSIIQKVTSRTTRRTPKEYLLIFALKNYFNFIKRTLTDLEYHINHTSYGQSNINKEITAAKEDAQSLYDHWKAIKIAESFTAILNAVFPQSSLSSSKYFIPFFDWLNSYSKLHLTHPATTSQRELIDLFNGRFQERLNHDSKAYHYLAEQLPLGIINQEGLNKLVSVLDVNPGDASLRDKLYANYIKHLESKNFRWHAEGDVHNLEAINHAYYFSQVFSAYVDWNAKWFQLYKTYRNVHEGWVPSLSDMVNHQRETYSLSVGIGIAHFKHNQKAYSEASEALFHILQIILKQFRSASDRTTIEYETPLWFAGATVARFTKSDKERFIKIICAELDSLQVFLRVVYEFLLNSKIINLSKTSRKNIERRIQDEFFLIETSKVNIELNKHVYYEKMKQFILDKLHIDFNE